MKNVFHNQDDFAVVGQEWIERLKSIARVHPLRRARLCLHRSDSDDVQEMVIAAHKSCLFRPHRHPEKTESFQIIEGRQIVLLFQPDGTPMQSIFLGPLPSGGQIAYRLCVPFFHTVLPIDEVVVYMETASGPFISDDAELAPWAPSSDDELKKYLMASALKTGVDEKLLLSASE